jgi:hypothetical protein
MFTTLVVTKQVVTKQVVIKQIITKPVQPRLFLLSSFSVTRS